MLKDAIEEAIITPNKDSQRASQLNAGKDLKPSQSQDAYLKYNRPNEPHKDQI